MVPPAAWDSRMLATLNLDGNTRLCRLQSLDAGYGNRHSVKLIETAIILMERNRGYSLP
jgi:hypothetical protein